MYFWKLEDLKSDIVKRPLTDGEVLPYVLGYGVFGMIGACASNPAGNFWDNVTAISTWATWIAGLVYGYHKNGGAKGKDFLHRYIPLSWVVSIRFVVFLSPFLIAVGIFTPRGQGTATTDWFEAMCIIILEVVSFWWIGHHVEDLAQRTATPPEATADRATAPLPG